MWGRLNFVAFSWVTDPWRSPHYCQWNSCFHVEMYLSLMVFNKVLNFQDYLRVYKKAKYYQNWDGSSISLIIIFNLTLTILLDTECWDKIRCRIINYSIVINNKGSFVFIAWTLDSINNMTLLEPTIVDNPVYNFLYSFFSVCIYLFFHLLFF